MKELSFKELERIVNEEGIKILEGWSDNRQEVQSSYQRNIFDAVQKKIYEVLDRYGFNRDEIRVSDYSNKLYLSHGYVRSGYGIAITVRKKKDQDRSDWRNTYYKFDKIEIEEVTKWDYEAKESKVVNTIQEYIDNDIAQKKASQEYKDKKYIDFRAKLDESGIDPKTFIELMNEYKNLEYDKKQAMAKEIDPERYYNYY